MRAILGRVNRGERLSAAEQRELESLHRQLNDAQEARELTEAGARAMGGVPSVEDSEVESRAFHSYLRRGVVSGELRAAGEATGSAGGYLVPPGWWQRLQIAKKAYGGTMSDFEEIESDTGQPMLWATIDPTNVVGTLIAENTQISDVDFTFGQGTLGAYLYSSGVHKVSRQMAHDSAFDIDAFVSARVAEALGRAEAAAAISGTGSAQPLGVITALAAASGLTSGGVFTLSAGSKVNVNASGASITGNVTQVTELNAGTLNPSTFVAVVKSVDPAYRALGAKWYMNDATFQASKLIVNSFGQPYYPELRNAEPSLEGYPVVVDNNIPALTASTASGVMFGHMPSAMVLRRVNHGGLLRLEERYADFLQVGYIGFERIDVRANDMRAAVVVKPAAS